MRLNIPLYNSSFKGIILKVPFHSLDSLDFEKSEPDSNKLRLFIRVKDCENLSNITDVKINFITILTLNAFLVFCYII